TRETIIEEIGKWYSNSDRTFNLIYTINDFLWDKDNNAHFSLADVTIGEKYILNSEIFKSPEFNNVKDRYKKFKDFQISISFPNFLSNSGKPLSFELFFKYI